MEEEVAHGLMEKSMREPDEAVFSKSQYVQQIEEQQMIQTPAGIKLIFNNPNLEINEKQAWNLCCNKLTAKNGWKGMTWLKGL